MRIVWATTDLITFSYKRIKQCSGSVGSVRFRMFGPPGSFHQQAKKLRKTFISTVLRLLYDFLSLKNNDVNLPAKRNEHKNLENKKYFLLVSWRSLTKRAESRSGSVSQNVRDPAGLKNELIHMTRKLSTAQGCRAADAAGGNLPSSPGSG